MAMQSGFIKRIRDIMRMDAGINGDAQRIEQMVWMCNPRQARRADTGRRYWRRNLSANANR